MRRNILSVLFIMSFFMLIHGCLGGDDENAGGHEGETASADITALEGGTLSTPSGAASIDIPAGALAEDTTITITSLGVDDQPDAENLGSDVYEFGPDGTEFLAPVTISLVLDVDVPEKMQAVLAVLDGEEWTTVEGSALDGNTVAGQVTHFSKYSIHFVGDDTVLESEDEVCKDLNFTACGGDVVGSWKILSMCTSRTIAGENPFADKPACADDIFEFNVDWIGEITFNEDGTYENTMGMSYWTHLELTDECLGEIVNGATTDYTMVCQKMFSDEDNEESLCTYESGLCKCDTKPETRNIDDSQNGTYTIEGNNMILDDGDDEVETLPFCVDGDRIVVESADDDTQDVSHFVCEKL